MIAMRVAQQPHMHRTKMRIVSAGNGSVGIINNAHAARDLKNQRAIAVAEFADVGRSRAA